MDNQGIRYTPNAPKYGNYLRYPRKNLKWPKKSLSIDLMIVNLKLIVPGKPYAFDAHFRGPKKQRSCTDVVFGVVFVAVMIAWVGMGVWGEWNLGDGQLPDI